MKGCVIPAHTEGATRGVRDAEWGCGARRRWVAPSSSGGASFRRPALRPVPGPKGQVIGPWDSRRVKRASPQRAWARCSGRSHACLAGGSSWMGLAPRLPTDGPSTERGSPKSPRRAPGRRPKNADYPLGTSRAPATPRTFPGGQEGGNDHDSDAEASREGEAARGRGTPLSLRERAMSLRSEAS
jgi:hypothetical protein